LDGFKIMGDFKMGIMDQTAYFLKNNLPIVLSF